VNRNHAATATGAGKARENKLKKGPRQPTWKRARAIYAIGRPRPDNPNVPRPRRSKGEKAEKTNATFADIKRIVDEFDQGLLYSQDQQLVMTAHIVPYLSGFRFVCYGPLDLVVY
jgi:hypothetical protein